MSKEIKIDVFETVTSLTARVEHWEQHELRTANEKLYGILADSLTFVYGLKEDRTARVELNTALDEREFKHTKSTPIETKVVKLIFGVEKRQRVYLYSRVLREAVLQSVAANDLPTWIYDNGGVENIRSGAANSDGETKLERQQRHVELGKQTVMLRDTICTMLACDQTPDQNGPVVLVGFLNRDGTTDIKGFVPDATLIKKAYEIFGKSAEVANDNAKTSSSDNSAKQKSGTDVGKTIAPTQDENGEWVAIVNGNPLANRHSKMPDEIAVGEGE